MACRVSLFAAVAALLTVAGCSNYQRPQRPAWRAQAENACIAERRVHLSRFIQPRGREIDGPGICGLTHPFLVGALSGDQVQLDTVATLDCPMIAALDRWVAEVVQPDAQARFGTVVTQIDTMGSYSCRGMNGQAGARISEHAFGNAIDIAGFRLADGRRITVVRDWTRGDEQTQAFLRDVHAGACSSFTTVLGPGANVFHYNHIHVDLAMHGNTSSGLRRICKPVPQTTIAGPRRDLLPDPPMVEEEQDMADGRPPRDPESLHPGPGSLVAGAPPPYAGAPSTYAPSTYAPSSYAPSSHPSSNYAPSSYAHAPQATRGAIRDDGAFVPEGSAQDWDATSSIPVRR